MKRLLAALLVLAAVSVRADATYYKLVAVTASSQTIVFDRPLSSVTFYNCSDGTTPTCAGEQSYFRVFRCGETFSAATTAYSTLPLGETVGFTYRQGIDVAPFCAASIVADTGETANVRIYGL